MGWVEVVYGLSPQVSRYVRGRPFTSVTAGLHLRHTVPCHASVGVAGASVMELGLYIFGILFFSSSVVADDHSPMGGSDDVVIYTLYIHFTLALGATTSLARCTAV